MVVVEVIPMEEVEGSIREEEVEGLSSVEDVHRGLDARTITTTVMIVICMGMVEINLDQREEAESQLQSTSRGGEMQERVFQVHGSRWDTFNRDFSPSDTDVDPDFRF